MSKKVKGSQPVETALSTAVRKQVCLNHSGINLTHGYGFQPRSCPEIRAKRATIAAHSLGGLPREQKMLKGHLPRVIYHQVYNACEHTKVKGSQPVETALSTAVRMYSSGRYRCLARKSGQQPQHSQLIVVYLSILSDTRLWIGPRLEDLLSL
jgi:hypothetical protein